MRIGLAPEMMTLEEKMSRQRTTISLMKQLLRKNHLLPNFEAEESVMVSFVTGIGEPKKLQNESDVENQNVIIDKKTEPFA